MRLDNLTKVTIRSKKRVGRGIGSGKGKTGGRGTKGQKARGKVSLGFIGGTLPIYKKLPMLRGWGGRGGHNMKSASRNLTLDISALNIFPKGSEINLESLIEKGLVNKSKANKLGVKIVGKGELKNPLIINLPTTSSVKASVERAGGKVNI